GPHARIGTCGIERTGMQVSIQGDQGRELKPFETGEICVIGPAVFAGYYDNPEANAKAFRDGWFRTGDLGHMDEEGFVYITGRATKCRSGFSFGTRCRNPVTARCRSGWSATSWRRADCLI